MRGGHALRVEMHKCSHLHSKKHLQIIHKLPESQVTVTAIHGKLDRLHLCLFGMIHKRHTISVFRIFSSWIVLHIWTFNKKIWKTLNIAVNRRAICSAFFAKWLSLQLGGAAAIFYENLLWWPLWARSGWFVG